MYVLKSCFLKKRDSEESYQNYDISRFTLGQIFNTFTDGYFVLTHTKLRGTFYITLEKIRTTDLQLIDTMTLSQWFSHNQKYALDTAKTPPVYKHGVVRYSDAILAGYNIERIGRRMPRDSNISNADRIDLYLEKKGVKPIDLYNYALFSVAGFIHRHYPHEDGVCLLNGGETFNLTKVNTVGVMSFKDCGKIRPVEIKTDMIYNSSSTVPLTHEILIKTDEDLTGKSVMLVLAGHPIVSNAIIEKVTDESGIVKIRTKKLRLLDIILNAVGRINTDDLGVFLDKRSTVLNKVNVNDIYSDICITRLFTLPQTFLVLVDTDNLGMDRVAVSTTGLPTVYDYHEEPQYPLITSRGLIQEYWKQMSPWGWIVKTTDDIEKFKLYQTNLTKYHDVINNSSYTYRWYHDKPEFIMIRSTTKLPETTK